MSTLVTAPSLPSFLGGSTSKPADAATNSVVVEATAMSSKSDLCGDRAVLTGSQGSNNVEQPKPWKGAKKESARLKCPHCKCPCVIRGSEQMSVLTRQYVYFCTNAECGHTFVATLEISRTLSPSATPDPSINLPFSTHVRRSLIRAALDLAASAEHQTRSTSPVTGDLFMQGDPAPD